MSSLILQTATRYLLPLLVLFSIFLLIRGHHEPGGGFIGGLVAASAVGLCALAFDAPTARRMMIAEPHHLAGLGLLTALASGIPGLLEGAPYLTAVWASTDVPGIGHLEVGTPLLFDVGVYFTVVGVVLAILLTLAEE